MGNTAASTSVMNLASEEDDTRDEIPDPTPMPTPLRKHPRRKWQQIGPLKCEHCPFRTNTHSSLGSHYHHHLVKLAAKCFFCTFSAANSSEILKHINRVHPEEKQNELVQQMRSNKCKSMLPASGSSLTAESLPKRATYMNCSFCPFSAGNNRILVTHMIRAHSEKKKKLKKSAPSVQALAEALALAAENLPPTAMEEEVTHTEVFHMDAVEPVEQLEDQSLPQHPPIVNNVLLTHKEEESVNIPTIPIKAEATVPIVPEEVEVVIVPKPRKEVEIVDITMDTDDEEDAKSPVVHKSPVEVSCLCGRSQPINRSLLMISCQGCQGWFHGSCVNISEATGKQMEKDDADWFCPRCVPKESLIRHPSKLIQDVENLAKPFQPSHLEGDRNQLGKRKSAMQSHSQKIEERNCRAEMAKLAKEGATTFLQTEKGLEEGARKMWETGGMWNETKLMQDFDYLAKRFQPSDLEGGPNPLGKEMSAAESQSQKEEERICRAVMAKLAIEIKEAQAIISQTEKGLKDVRKMRESRSMEVEKLRRMVEELELKKRGLAVELRVYKDQKKEVDRQLTELTVKKIQLERDLAKLKDSTVGKLLIKLEPSSLHSSATLSGNREAIQGMETRLIKVKGELVEILKGDAYISDRIVATEKTMAEIDNKLLAVRVEYDSLKGDPASGSSIVDKMKALKNEQRSRIANFIKLEKRVVDICYEYVFDEIRRKESEWIKALEDGEENL